MSDGKCGLGLALKVRPNTKPDTGDWSKRKGPFTLDSFAEALKRVNWRVQRGTDLWTAVGLEKARLSAMHNGLRLFLEHALDAYFEYHEARQEQLGPLQLIDTWVVVEEKSNSALSAWGALYESPHGNREFRRFRFDTARSAVTPWAHIGARVAAKAAGRYPVRRIWITEVGLRNGIEHHVLSGITAEDAEDLYERFGRDAAITATAGEDPTPGPGCSGCKITGACTALIRAPGFLGVDLPGSWTRSVSASDLEQYEQCPSRWYMQREIHLPHDIEDSAPLLRGQAVHEVLALVHARGCACNMNDFPPPDGGPLVFADRVIDPAAYAIAYPYLVAHIASCQHQSELEVIAAERTIYCYDPDADAVIATKADALWRRGDALVLREIKTVERDVDTTADMIFGRYLAVAWGLGVLASGMASHFGARRGAVQLEIVSPTRSQVFVYSTDDIDLMKMARGRIRRLADKWLYDTTWEPNPNAHCGTCPVRRWCSVRDDWSNRYAVNAGAGLPPF